MPIEVKMAKLSPTMESGKLVSWLVKVGDQVREGQTLAEVQTDKATMPMEAFDAGTVAHLDVKEGDEVQLGARVLVLAKKGEDPAAVVKGLSAKAGPATPAPKAEAPAPKAEATNGHATAPTPAPTTAAEVPAASGRVRSSPLARSIAKKAGIDLAQVAGTGPNGRVVRKDVEAFLASGPATRTAAVPRAGVAPAAAARPDEKQPLSRIRATIAKRMSEAARVAPVIHLSVDVKLDRVLDVREQLNKSLAAEKVKLGVGDFITKGVAAALRRHPEMNASYFDDGIVRHGRVNVGIAVALEDGLIVPVLHDADRLGLVEVRKGTDAIAVAARAGKLSPAQLEGGTFTISNLGMFGIKQFDAILNLPQVGILAVGAGEPRAIVEDGRIVAATVMTATLTADHRALDGADAARFLATLKGFLEEPATMLL